MRLKWYFRNEPTSDFSENQWFTPKSSWKPPTRYPNLEVFLSELEKQIFKIVDSKLGYSSFSKEKWQAMRALADEKSLVIKTVDKGSTVAAWDLHTRGWVMCCKFYINDSGDFINKTKNLQNIAEGAILVSADIVSLYPSIAPDVVSLYPRFKCP